MGEEVETPRGKDSAELASLTRALSVRVTKGFGASGVYSSFFRVMET